MAISGFMKEEMVSKFTVKNNDQHTYIYSTKDHYIVNVKNSIEFWCGRD